MMKCPRMVLAVAALLLAVSPMLGAAPNVEDLQKKVDALTSRVKQLEGKQATLKPDVRAICKEMMVDAGGRSATPRWLKNLVFFGDLRLRYETLCYIDNPDNVSRGRARFRLRFGFIKYFLNKQMEVGFRLASGEATDGDVINDHLGSDPTSSNQSFNDNFSEKPIWIDRAYASYRPNAIKGLFLIAGKMPNPFRSTDIIWDSDVNPEGAYAEYQYGGFGVFQPFAGFGYFLARELSSSHGDTFFLAYVVGFDWQVVKGVKVTMAATYYDWDNARADVQAKIDASSSNIRGNTTGWPWNFEIIDVVTKVSWTTFNLPTKAYVEWAQNCAADDSFRDQDNAYAFGVQLGKAKKKGTWQVAYKYAYIEPNAVFGYFTDSDFGFANRKGHKLGGAYALTDSLVAAVTIFVTEPVRSSTEDKQVKIQADLIWKL